MGKVPDIATVAATRRNQTEARRVAREAYPFCCCVICGLQIETCLTIAHLDSKSGQNDADNLAYLCWTHHWMYDAGFYPVEAIRKLRDHWQETKGVPDRSIIMGPAAAAAVRTRKRKAAARKAVKTRQSNQAKSVTEI